MDTKQIALAIVICASLLAGCKSPGPYGKFYTDWTHNTVTNLPPYSGKTSIYPSTGLAEDIKKLQRQNYILLGESYFTWSEEANRVLMLRQAKAVGADIVLWSQSYLGSEQSTAIVPMYQPGQTYTTTSSGSVNVNAYGSSGYAYGSANYNGSETTTTPGTFSTQTVPITIHHYSHDAVFFRKTKQPVMGAAVVRLSDDLRTKLQRNTGAVVSLVIDDSPAFKANIFEGDVLLQIEGEEISSPVDYVEKIRKLAGQKVSVEVWRNGQTKIISVQLNVREDEQPKKPQ